MATAFQTKTRTSIHSDANTSASPLTPSLAQTKESNPLAEGVHPRTADDVISSMRLARCSLLCACALALGFLESTIPLPVSIPGVKLGLSNLAVVIALFAVDARSALVVAFVKILANGLLFGSPLMMAYSTGGTVLSFAALLVCRCLPQPSLVFASMLSAICHNAGQLLVAALFLGSWSVTINAIPLSLAACVTGALTGVVAQAVIPSVRAAL